MIILQKINKVKDISRMCGIFSIQFFRSNLEIRIYNLISNPKMEANLSIREKL